MGYFVKVIEQKIVLCGGNVAMPSLRWTLTAWAAGRL